MVSAQIAKAIVDAKKNVQDPESALFGEHYEGLYLCAIMQPSDYVRISPFRSFRKVITTYINTTLTQFVVVATTIPRPRRLQKHYEETACSEYSSDGYQFFHSIRNRKILQRLLLLGRNANNAS